MIPVLTDSSDYEGSSEGEEEELDPEHPDSPNRFAYLPPEQRMSVSVQRAAATLSPSEMEVKHGIRAVITNFESTVAQFTSMLEEPKLEVFYSPPKYDLKVAIHTVILYTCYTFREF